LKPKFIDFPFFFGLQSCHEVLAMNPARLLAFVLALLAPVPVLANDQQKAQKELNNITAMARDFTGRTIVNLTMSKTFNVPRTTLVQERSETGANYGSLFLAHELAKAGTPWADLATDLKAGKKITEVASEHHVDWKAIAESAKRFNGTVDHNLYNYFIAAKSAPAKTTAAPSPDQYDVHHDGVKADADDASDKEIADAQNRFVAMKDSAAKAKGDNKTQGLADERIGYSDHTQGPGAVGTGAGGSANTNTGTTAPGFGGPQ
jgi:hypothetical protein